MFRSDNVIHKRSRYCYLVVHVFGTGHALPIRGRLLSLDTSSIQHHEIVESNSSEYLMYGFLFLSGANYAYKSEAKFRESYD